MSFHNFADISDLLGLPIWLIIVITIWSLIWKGLALWKSARKNHLVWFIILLVVNTLGILEILYFFLFSKVTIKKKTKKKRKNRQLR